jgi:Fic family protein
MSSLGFQLREQIAAEAISDEVIGSSAIEGEDLDRAKVRSSVARRLGIETAAVLPEDRKVEGVVAMLLDATQHFAAALTTKRLFGWHAALFPVGYSGLLPITVGDWRKDLAGPMQVISGRFGHEIVHYVAPPAACLEHEMNRFIDWFNGESQAGELLLKASVAHLWFVTLHPLDDGNGRVGRALTDLLLARSEQSGQRFYSMSSQIQKERDTYYEILKETQRGDLDITNWMVWFLDCLDRALSNADSIVDAVMEKSMFWHALDNTPMNERQKLMINRLLDNFEGNLTVKKWAAITKVSHDTANRDIQYLVDKNVLATSGAARSTHYILAR